MSKTKRETKKLVVYQHRKSFTIWLHPTYADGKMKSHKKAEAGQTFVKSKSDAELGAAIRKQFENCL